MEKLDKSMALDSSDAVRFGITAVVLAAGRGRRFDPTGVSFKLVQPLADGRPMIRTVCQNVLACVDEVLVVCGPYEAEIRRVLAGLPVRFVSCANADAGMGASVKCGIAASNPGVGWLLMLGDMPYVDQHTIHAVTSALRQGAYIARPFYQSKPGHPVGFSATHRIDLLALEDAQEGARELIQSHPDRLARIDLGDRGCIADIDTPFDLVSALRS